MELKLRGKFYHHKRWVVARCPELDVASQGEDEADARRMLTEAVQILLEETARRGTLGKVLQEAELPVVPLGTSIKVLIDFGKGTQVSLTAKV